MEGGETAATAFAAAASSRLLLKEGNLGPHSSVSRRCPTLGTRTFQGSTLHTQPGRGDRSQASGQQRHDLQACATIAASCSRATITMWYSARLSSGLVSAQLGLYNDEKTEDNSMHKNV